MDNSKASEIAKEANSPRKRQHDEVPPAESKKTKAKATFPSVPAASTLPFSFGNQSAPAATSTFVGFGSQSPAKPGFAFFGPKPAPATGFGFAGFGQSPPKPAFNRESFADGFKEGFEAGVKAASNTRGGGALFGNNQAKAATSTFDPSASQSAFDFGNQLAPARGGNDQAKPATSAFNFGPKPFAFGPAPAPAPLSTTAPAM